MKKIFLILYILLGLNLHAEYPNKQSIQMDFAKDPPKTDEYSIAKDFTINLLNRLKQHQENLKAGKIAQFEIGNTPTDFYKFYAASYLLCSITNGTCPAFLDAILEIDVINSKIKQEAKCQNILLMWKSWLENDMEKRHSHQTKIVHVNAVSKFNREDRPRYLKCSNTIQDLIADATISSTDFFKKRYSNKITKADYVDRALEFLAAIEKKEINIYEAVGLID